MHLSAFFARIFLLSSKPKPTETESLIQKPKFRLLNQTFGFVSAQPLFATLHLLEASSAIEASSSLFYTSEFYVYAKAGTAATSLGE